MTRSPAGETARRAVRCLVAGTSVTIALAAFFLVYRPWTDTGGELLPGGAFEAPGSVTGDGPWKVRGSVEWEDGDRARANGLVRLTAGPPAARLHASLADVPAAELLVFRGRVRTAGVRPGPEPYAAARVVVFFRDETGRGLWEYRHQAARLRGASRWRWVEDAFPIPPEAASAHVAVIHAAAEGTVWVDDLSLRPGRAPAGLMPWRLFWWIVWGATFVACSRELGLWNGWRRRVLVLLATLIAIGVTAPQPLLRKATERPLALARSLAPGPSATEKPGPPSPGPETAASAGSPARPAPTTRPPPSPATKTGAPAATSAAQPSPPETTSAGPSASPADPEPDPGQVRAALLLIKKSGHFALFLLLGVTAALAAGPTARARVLVLVLAGLLVFAASTEVLQVTVPERQPSLRDWLIDLAGATVGLVLGAGLARLARRAPGLPRGLPAR